MTLEKYAEKDHEDQGQPAKQHSTEAQETKDEGKKEHRAFFSSQADPSKSSLIFMHIEDEEKVLELCLRKKGLIDDRQAAKLVSDLSKTNPDGKMPSLPPENDKKDPAKKPC
jgi:hypothetical protein